jgi:malate synthase
VGFRGEPTTPSVLLLRNNNLHIEINVDRDSMVGRTDPAGITDLVLEAAITTIMDLEDSVAAVDAEDKVALYRNWLGLMKGTLTSTFEKGGKSVERRLNTDKRFITSDGGAARSQSDADP